MTTYMLRRHNEYSDNITDWPESRDDQYSNPDDQWEDLEFQDMRRGAKWARAQQDSNHWQ